MERSSPLGGLRSAATAADSSPRRLVGARVVEKEGRAEEKELSVPVTRAGSGNNGPAFLRRGSRKKVVVVETMWVVVVVEAYTP